MAKVNAKIDRQTSTVKIHAFPDFIQVPIKMITKVQLEKVSQADQ